MAQATIQDGSGYRSHAYDWLAKQTKVTTHNEMKVGVVLCFAISLAAPCEGSTDVEQLCCLLGAPARRGWPATKCLTAKPDSPLH